MADMIEFDKAKEEIEVKKNTEEITIDILEEIEKLKDKKSSYDKDDMIATTDWDGECWKTFFENAVKQMCWNYKKEGIEVDEWDVLVVFMHQFLMSKEES